MLKTCYNGLKLKSHKPKVKWNWYKSLRILLSKWDSEYLIIDEPLIYNEDAITQKIIQISECLRNIRLKSQKIDITSMKNSSSMPLYQNFKTHVNPESYLNENVNWNVTRMITQCRANLSQITCCSTTLKLASLQNFYDKLTNKNCTYCSLDVEENLYHVIFECPKYNHIRYLLQSINFPVTETEYLLCFKNLTIESMKTLYIYMQNVINLRNEST